MWGPRFQGLAERRRRTACRFVETAGGYMRPITPTLLTLAVVTLAAGVRLEAQHRSSRLITAEKNERARGVSTPASAAGEPRRRGCLPRQGASRLPGGAGEPLHSTPVRVYLNDVNMGEVDYLKTIPAARVLELQMLSTNETASRFGPTDGQAAIVVTLKR